MIWWFKSNLVLLQLALVLGLVFLAFFTENIAFPSPTLTGEGIVYIPVVYLLALLPAMVFSFLLERSKTSVLAIKPRQNWLKLADMSVLTWYLFFWIFAAGIGEQHFLLARTALFFLSTVLIMLAVGVASYSWLPAFIILLGHMLLGFWPDSDTHHPLAFLFNPGFDLLTNSLIAAFTALGFMSYFFSQILDR